ncbi:HNH endonuclease [Mycobacteroides abscessus]|uniref:HNH endonuclease n=1 Tax=Mycobacteroides abscessus TaxID=36809 RepID=UPI0005E40812|nr:HNH endonuclease [Mycobacteroides abscessus]CPR96183.1 Alpha/beta hydrolase of uncharacterised function (DUF1023) [Mycobacteroides abscessus]CPS62254.1 Alpha/beta hydrolase of uncharacterised function (DUF1023) [Mycobacteroides abscessus]CPY44591.1 Alpha/beta hydrolase of uncharacterised function (DUF1023) [Mycobacteroides abscessus]CPY52398.1 Alpha/beta hydrolase of uncharacterised function (DUF1023) [Mycobacteroides abscessus]SLI81109.1 Alpha/beta hydrolase of uncharacterised function (DU
MGTLTIADTLRWNPEAVRGVENAINKHGATAQEISDALYKLPLFQSWEGESGSAAKESLDKLSKYLVAHADEMESLGKALGKAAVEIENVRKELRDVLNKADEYGMDIDPVSGAVKPTAAANIGLPATTIALRMSELQTDIKNVLAHAESVDTALASAISGSGTTTPTAKHGGSGALDLAERLKGISGDKPATTTPANALPNPMTTLLGEPPKSPLEQQQMRPVAMAPKLDLNTPEGKAATEQMRAFLASRYPPNEVESRLQAAIKFAQSDRPLIGTPPETSKAAPGLKDGYANEFKAMGEHLLDVTGLNGPDRQVNALKETVDGLNKQALLATNPGLMMMDGAQSAINEAVTDYQHPEQIPNRTGQHLADATAILGTAPLGGEGALGRLGMEEAAAGRAGLGNSALPHALHDPPAPGKLHDEPVPPSHAQPAQPHVDTPPSTDHHVPATDDHHHPPVADEHPHIDFGNLEPPHNDTGGSTYKERIDQTPINNGHWVGERGESEWISKNPEVNKFLHDANVDGIHYSNAQPDFSPVAKGQVEIPEMTTSRDQNFRVADKLLAKEWGVSPQEIADWRSDNKYTWHEEPDLKTMQLVPSVVNNRLGHVGGIGELNAGKTLPPTGDGHP